MSVVAAGASPHRGWLANLAQVAQYHLRLIVLGLLAWLVLPLHWSPAGVVAALVWSAATHALLDRLWPVRRLLEHIGSPKFARLNAGGLNGMYAADQALHGLALGIRPCCWRCCKGRIAIRTAAAQQTHPRHDNEAAPNHDNHQALHETRDSVIDAATPAP